MTYNDFLEYAIKLGANGNSGIFITDAKGNYVPLEENVIEISTQGDIVIHSISDKIYVKTLLTDNGDIEESKVKIDEPKEPGVKGLTWDDVHRCIGDARGNTI